MTYLTNRITEKELKKLINDKNTYELSTFVFDRFNERFLLPLNSIEKDKRHGFSTMAISCLLIESYVTYLKGWKTSNRNSKKTFDFFFNNIKNFKCFKDYGNSFYYDLRCGIIHQSETRNGWKIRRVGKLFDSNSKTINATKFFDLLNLEK